MAKKKYWMTAKAKARRAELRSNPEYLARENAQNKARIHASPYNFVRNKVHAMRSVARKRGHVWELFQIFN